MRHSKAYIAVSPGETIKKQLKFRQMSQKEFAKQLAPWCPPKCPRFSF